MIFFQKRTATGSIGFVLNFRLSSSSSSSSISSLSACYRHGAINGSMTLHRGDS